MYIFHYMIWYLSTLGPLYMKMVSPKKWWIFWWCNSWNRKMFNDLAWSEKILTIRKWFPQTSGFCCSWRFQVSKRNTVGWPQVWAPHRAAWQLEASAVLNLRQRMAQCGWNLLVGCVVYHRFQYFSPFFFSPFLKMDKYTVWSLQCKLKKQTCTIYYSILCT